MNQIQVISGSVVHAPVDAIVNAANTHLLAGGGVCGAIFNQAGVSQLQAACDAIGSCPTGSAVITDGFHCRAKYIIHAVGPIYSGRKTDALLLASAYRSCLDRAEEKNLTSIGFCSISTGIFGYPLKDAAKIAVDVLQNYPVKSVKDIRIYCFAPEEYKVFSTLANQSASR